MPGPLIGPVMYPAAMSRIIATAEASRIPVAMNGAALGSDTIRIVANPGEPERPVGLLRQRVDVVDAGDRVVKHGPDGAVDDQRDRHPQPRPEQQADQRNERYRRDRPQELHDGPGRDPHAGQAAEQHPERDAHRHGDRHPDRPRLHGRTEVGDEPAVARQQHRPPSTDEVSGSAERLMMPSRPAASASSRNTTTPVAPRAQRPVQAGQRPAAAGGAGGGARRPGGTALTVGESSPVSGRAVRPRPRG